jgi:hypothetical protein
MTNSAICHGHLDQATRIKSFLYRFRIDGCYDNPLTRSRATSPSETSLVSA